MRHEHSTYHDNREASRVRYARDTNICCERRAVHLNMISTDAWAFRCTTWCFLGFRNTPCVVVANLARSTSRWYYRWVSRVKGFNALLISVPLFFTTSRDQNRSHVRFTSRRAFQDLCDLSNGRYDIRWRLCANSTRSCANSFALYSGY